MDSMTVQLSIVIVTVHLSSSFSIDDVAWMLLIEAGSETRAVCVPCGGGGLLSWTLGEILPREWAMARGQLAPQQESALAQATGRVLVLAQKWMLGWEQVLGPGQVLVLVLGWEQALGQGLGLGLGWELGLLHGRVLSFEPPCNASGVADAGAFDLARLERLGRAGAGAGAAIGPAGASSACCGGWLSACAAGVCAGVLEAAPRERPKCWNM